MQIEIKITEGSTEKTFSFSDREDAEVDRILETAKKYRLDLLGSWSKARGEAVMVHCDERLSSSEFSILARLFAGEWGRSIPDHDFTGPIYKWVRLVEHYDFPKLPPLDLSLICGAVLAVWERATMNVSPDERIVLGGEPDYCPIYGPASKMWKIVKSCEGDRK